MLAGCGSKTDASENNFGAVIADELKKIELCLPFEKWPYRVVANDSARMGQMAALEAAGLVSGADFEADKLNLFSKPTGRKIKFKSYSLTEVGKKFFREKGTAKTDAVVNGNLCYGKLALDKVIKWEGPINQMVTVTYLTELDDLADWVKKPELQAVFPGTAKFIADSLVGGENKASLKLTNIGWEPIIASGSGMVVVTRDASINPADYLNLANYLPVATPAANVVSAPTKLQSSAAKHPQVQETASKKDKNAAKESNTPQVRLINLNE